MPDQPPPPPSGDSDPTQIPGAGSPWGSAPPPDLGKPASPPPQGPPPQGPPGAPPTQVGTPGYPGHPQSGTQPPWASYPTGPSYPSGPYRPSGPWQPGPPRGPHRRTGLLAVVGVVLFVVLTAGTALGVALLRGGDEGSEAGDDPTGSPTGSTSSSAPTEPTEPTESTDPTTPTDPVEPTEPTTPPVPTSPPAPTEPVDPPAGDPFSYQEYAKDWEFQFPGSPRLNADFKKGWDYDSCAGVENDAALTALGCRRASEWTYRALDGDLALSHIVLTMKSAKAAAKAIDDELIEEMSWQLEDDAFLTGKPGAWRANNINEFIVISVETHQESVPAKKAADYLRYGNTDIIGALGFRF